MEKSYPLKKATILVFVVSILVLVYSFQIKDQENEKISKVENGLADIKYFMKNTSLMFDNNYTDTLPRLNISDRMEKYNVPGISIAVIKNYKLEWAKGYGVLESGADKKVTTETLFQAASTSKPLATTIVLHLVEEGKLDLDKDVNTYLRSWKVPYDTIKEKVTLRLLITHMSGINRPGDGFSYEKGSSPTLVQVIKGEKPAINDPFHFDNLPKTKFQYSNLGYMIIQLVLEDYFQMTYQEIVSKYIFSPLRMKSSYMFYPFTPEIYTRLSNPHNRKGVVQDYGLHPSALACSGLVTTPTDLAKFAIELMLTNKGKSKRILRQESVHSMFTKTTDIDPRLHDGFSQFGLGVFLMGEGDNSYFFHQGGNNSGASCIMAASTSSGNGIIIMTNGLSGLYISVEIMASVAREYGWHGIQ